MGTKNMQKNLMKQGLSKVKLYWVGVDWNNHQHLLWLSLSSKNSLQKQHFNSILYILSFSDSVCIEVHVKFIYFSDRPNDPEDSRSHHVPSYWECFSTFCQQTILHGWHYLTAEAASTSTPSTPACCRCCTCDNCRAPPRTSLLDYSLTNLSGNKIK